MRRSWEVADGLALESGTGDLHASWFEALTEVEEEARRMQFETNADRMERRVRRRVGWE